jgi:hypothetical protein
MRCGRGEQSGAEVAMPPSAVAEWRDGPCTSHKAYPRKEAVFEELGISEDQLGSLVPNRVSFTFDLPLPKSTTHAQVSAFPRAEEPNR